MTTWVYIRSEANLYTVGFYDPSGKWNPDSDWGTREEARERVHYLNSGKPEQSESGGSWEEYQHFKKTHGGL